MYLSRLELKPHIKGRELAKSLTENQNDRETKRAYSLHQHIWKLFPNMPEAERDFLFREEAASQQNLKAHIGRFQPVYYVLSHRKPDDENSIFRATSKAYQPKLENGDELSFKLRVNAVKSRNDGKERHDIVMNSQITWLTQQLKSLELDATGKKEVLKSRLLEYANDTDIEAWRQIISKGPLVDVLERRLARSEILEWVLKTVIEEGVLNWWKQQADKHGFSLLLDNDGLPIFNASSYQKHWLPEKGRHASFCSIDLSGQIRVENAEVFSHLLASGIGKSRAFGCGLMLIKPI